MNRIFILATLFLTLISAKGYDNYFQDGTVWEMQVTGTQNPYPVYTDVHYELDGDTIVNGYEALKMYQRYEGEERKLFSVIRIEDEKVYFQSYKEAESWTILYDFGLKEGEGCHVGIIDTRWPIKQDPIVTYMKCTSINEDELDGYTIMHLEEYTTYDTEYEFPGYGIWIKGIGSPRGVTFNSYFEAVGGTGKLMLVHCKATGATYKRDTNSGIGDVTNNNPLTVRCDKGGHTLISNINESAPLIMYAIDGNKAAHIEHPMANETIRLANPGIYIIRNGDTIKKAIIH